jgi:hypothetical protein
VSTEYRVAEEPNSWLELVWTAERDTESELDVQEFVYSLMETARENLKNDGYLTHAGWVIEPKAIHCFEIGHKSWEFKQEVYGRLVEKAKELKAEAIVTLADAYWSDEKYDPATYYQGKLAKEGKECIWLTVTAPDKPTWSLQSKYKRIEGKVIFEPIEREEGDQVFLLGSWSKEMRAIQ